MMLPTRGIAKAALRTTLNCAEQAARATASSSSSSRLTFSSSRHQYAPQAGQPMPPPPPKDTSDQPSSGPSHSTTGSSPTKEPTRLDTDSTTDAVQTADEANSTAKGKDIQPISSLASQYLDMTEIPASAAEEQQRTGARSTSGKRPMSSIEKRRRNLGRAMLGATIAGVGVYAWHLGREWDTEREKERIGRSVTVEEGLTGRWQRGQARLLDTLDYFNKPAWEPLIPEPLPPPHQKPYTLVLSLDDLLIHSTWDREHGWRTAKRPGVDYFLAYLSQFYEIVLFTSQPSYTAAPIVEKLDPHMIYILYKLYKDCIHYVKGQSIKDLSYLGRDLRTVIMIDTVPEHFKLQPENAIHMQPWNGDRNDTDLVGIIPFLEAIIYFNLPDVRPVLQKYHGKHIPTEWANFEAEQKRKVLEEWEAQKATRKGKLRGGFGSLFGMSSSSSSDSDYDAPPKTPLEAYRQAMQKQYIEEQKYWAENKEAIEKAIEEDKQKQMKEMTSSVFNFVAATVGLQPPPAPSDAPAPSGGQSNNQNK